MVQSRVWFPCPVRPCRGISSFYLFCILSLRMMCLAEVIQTGWETYFSLAEKFDRCQPTWDITLSISFSEAKGKVKIHFLFNQGWSHCLLGKWDNLWNTESSCLFMWVQAAGAKVGSMWGLGYWNQSGSFLTWGHNFNKLKLGKEWRMHFHPWLNGLWACLRSLLTVPKWSKIKNEIFACLNLYSFCDKRKPMP